MRFAPVLAAIALLSACGGTPSATTVATAPGFPPAPAAPDGPLPEHTLAALDRVWDALPEPAPADVVDLGRSGDVRLAWLLADLMRFTSSQSPSAGSIRGALAELMGVEIEPVVGWVTATDHLIAWDTPAPPDHLSYKRRLYTGLDERWAPFFTDDSDIDHRLVSWGGVYIDDRPPGDSSSCLGCIPALDDPAVTDVPGGDWYPDDRYVFGVTIGGESRAYPRNIMEVHEMVNDMLGGRRFALPYCTLCGSAVLYFTDDLDEPFTMPTLRTSGLLSRSNKIMYDVVTWSAFDTFTGRAVSGPLWEAGVALTRGTVITTTWGEWKAAYPDTTIVAFDAGGTRGYVLDPLGGRDDAGPIFPIGDRDPRLPVQEQVLGVTVPGGTAVAFPVGPAIARLQEGEAVAMAGVELRIDAGGLVAVVAGEPIPSSQSFWFAWSQFHPDTLLWVP
ncbi:MAG TPA: DUF3179 domain-containing (seleno)protein [Acidimicrobiia bacterium]|nr:DUF3179 domain-containing (seleno)protein [Acidimicrobiia bacterium]